LDAKRNEYSHKLLWTGKTHIPARFLPLTQLCKHIQSRYRQKHKVTSLGAPYGFFHLFQVRASARKPTGPTSDEFMHGRFDMPSEIENIPVSPWMQKRADLGLGAAICPQYQLILLCHMKPVVPTSMIQGGPGKTDGSPIEQYAWMLLGRRSVKIDFTAPKWKGSTTILTLNWKIPM